MPVIAKIKPRISNHLILQVFMIQEVKDQLMGNVKYRVIDMLKGKRKLVILSIIILIPLNNAQTYSLTLVDFSMPRQAVSFPYICCIKTLPKASIKPYIIDVCAKFRWFSLCTSFTRLIVMLSEIMPISIDDISAHSILLLSSWKLKSLTDTCSKFKASDSNSCSVIKSKVTSLLLTSNALLTYLLIHLQRFLFEASSFFQL